MLQFRPGFLLVLIFCVKHGNGAVRGEQNNPEANYCVTYGCNETVKEMKWEKAGEKITADPCNNFYEYACNGFFGRYHIYLDRLYKDHFSFMQDRVERQKMNIVLGQTRNKLPGSLPKIHQYYNLCLADADNNTVFEIRAYLDGLAEWPLFTENWNESEFSFPKYLGALWQAGIEAKEIINIKKLGKWHYDKFEISPANTFLQRYELKREFQSPKVMNYYYYMVNVSVLLGANKSTAEKDMRDVLILAMNLTSLIDYSEGYELLSAEDLYKEFPELNFKELLEAFCFPYYTVEDDTPLKAIYKYYKGLTSLLPKVSNRTLANFLFWSAFHPVVKYGDLTTFDPYKILYTWRSKQEKCIDMTKTNFGTEIVLARNLDILPRDQKKIVLKELNTILPYLQWLVANKTWLDNATKAKVLPFFKKSYFDAGYYDRMVTDENLFRILWWVNITESFFKTSVDILVSKRKIMFSERGQLEPKDYGLKGEVRPENRDPLTWLPANSLQSSMYTLDVPNYLKYGFYAGGVYKFLARNLNFGVRSRIINWDNKTVQTGVKQRLQCQIDELSKMNDTILKTPVQGIFGMNRHVIALGTIMATLKTYKELKKTLPQEPLLPGMNYTADQLFWLQAARASCTIYSHAYAKFNVGDPSYLGEYILVNSVFRNIKEFGEDWKCPKNSYMNNGNPCGIWDDLKK